jgi:hypothetical protein
MSEQNATSPTEARSDAPTELKYDQRIQHLRTGYDNSQAAVRFLDTKASAVIAVVPVVLGLLVGLYRWFDAAWRWEKMSTPSARWVWGILLSVCVLIATVLLYHSAKVLTAAFTAISPHGPSDSRPSVLFPYHIKTRRDVGADSPDRGFDKRIAFFVTDAAESDALEDYCRQIMRMSEILERKLTCVHEAVAHLKYVFVLALAIVVMLFLMTVGNAAIPFWHAAAQSAVKPVTPSTSPGP